MYRNERKRWPRFGTRSRWGIREAEMSMYLLRPEKTKRMRLLNEEAADYNPCFEGITTAMMIIRVRTYGSAACVPVFLRRPFNCAAGSQVRRL